MKTARRMCANLENKYKDLDWFRGISIKHDSDVGCYITIYIAKGYNPTIPTELDGVTIKMKTIGVVNAL
jgi:hypothetical protein